MVTVPHINMHYVLYSSSITAPQDAHKRLVLQIVEWLTDLLSGLARDELTIYITFITGFKNKLKCCHFFTIVCIGREPINSDTGIEK